MAGKLIYEGENPKTQTVEAVENLAAYLNKDLSNGVLDLGSVRLVLNAKKNAYYTTTASDCSCPARTYNPDKPCKHMAKHFPQEPKPIEGDLLSQVNSQSAREAFCEGMRAAGVV